MDGMLSQEEIDALTGGGGAATKTAYAGVMLREMQSERLLTLIWEQQQQHYQRC